MYNPTGVEYYLIGRLFQDISDFNNAFKYMKLSADMGVKYSKYILGTYYECGYGTIKDHDLAMKYFLQLADEKEDYVQSHLGYKYYSGSGVTQDYKMAFKYYKMAADIGSAYSQYQVALMYRDGRGTDQNYNLAIEYFIRAGRQNCRTDATLALGELYMQAIKTNNNILLDVLINELTKQKTDSKIFWFW